MLTISFIFNYCLFLVIFNLGWLLTKPGRPRTFEVAGRLFLPLVAALALTTLDQLRLFFFYKIIIFILILAVIYFQVLKKRRRR